MLQCKRGSLAHRLMELRLGTKMNKIYPGSRIVLKYSRHEDDYVDALLS